MPDFLGLVLMGCTGAVIVILTLALIPDEEINNLIDTERDERHGNLDSPTE